MFQTVRAIHWFRSDLRLRDNTALAEAAARPEEIALVFVFDDRLLPPIAICTGPLGEPASARRLSCSHRGPRPSTAAGARALPGRAAQGSLPMTPPGRTERGKTTSPRKLWQDDAPLRIGISSCLLGEEVRWDGGHKRDRFLTDVLGPHVEWVRLCPEVELGMGTPREPVRLVRRGDEIAMLGTRSGLDWTAPMRAWSETRARQLAQLNLCGYVLKKDSPSCGMERVKVRSEKGMPKKGGRGIFAEALLRNHPVLPVEEEGRLYDAVLRENFVERIFAYRRLRCFFEGSWSVGRLVAFHTAHKLQLMAHSPQAYRSLGRLVASAKGVPRGELRAQYQSEFMSALLQRATRKRHVNVLHHCIGHFRKALADEARVELAALIEDYRAERVPLVVPITMIGHYVRRLRVESLAGQVYLEPHPKELMLRNHV